MDSICKETVANCFWFLWPNAVYTTLVFHATPKAHCHVGGLLYCHQLTELEANGKQEKN
jgi:hypothetical protein